MACPLEAREDHCSVKRLRLRKVINLVHPIENLNLIVRWANRELNILLAGRSKHPYKDRTKSRGDFIPPNDMQIPKFHTPKQAENLHLY
jgi:hypothetical protein